MPQATKAESIMIIERENSNLRDQLKEAKYQLIESVKDKQVWISMYQKAKVEANDFQREVERLKAAHNGEICVDTMEYCERLKAENEGLREAGENNFFCEHEVADAFWRWWRENGETHVHGYYESTWGALRSAFRTALAPNTAPKGQPEPEEK